MTNSLPPFDTKQEISRIVTFLRTIATKLQLKRFVLGLSGGIDSTTALFLLQAAFPVEQIIVARLSYFPHRPEPIDNLLKEISFPARNIHYVSIKPVVDAAKKTTEQATGEPVDMFRLGNMMARARMILLYDLAKKYTGLVCGTENKSEKLLGYFTRFGDEASDIEPIQHLYKTFVYQLALQLGIPEQLRSQVPTAGLWKGQTDEQQLGFTYAEADNVLYLATEKQLSVPAIVNLGYPNAAKVIAHMEKNSFKHHTPYSLE